MGGRIEFARHRAGLTQTALGVLLGVSARTIQNYEAGRTTMPSDLLLLLEERAKVPHGWILYNSPSLVDEGENGSASTGVIATLFAACVLFFAPTSSSATVSCHCPPTYDSRQPRVKLARRAHRSSLPRSANPRR